jgi:hypothetical protein
MLRVSRTRRACYGPCVHVWNVWTRETHLFNTCPHFSRPGRTIDSPGPAVGTRCSGPKAPERLTAGSAGCCCCCDCSWSRASRKEVASAAGCRLERSASPDRVNARFGRALLYSTIRATVADRGRWRRRAGYDPVRQSLRFERRVRRRPAGPPQVRHRCRAARRGSTALSDSVGTIWRARAATGEHVPAGYYPNGSQVGYDAQAKEYRIALTGLDWRN